MLPNPNIYLTHTHTLVDKGANLSTTSTPCDFMLFFSRNNIKDASTDYANKQPYIVALMPLVHISVLVLLGSVIILLITVFLVDFSALKYNLKQTPRPTLC